MATLIIAEKPKSAERIAYALSNGKYKKVDKNKAPWYEFQKDGEKFYVVPAVGHLFVLKQKSGSWDYPVFDVEWTETFKVNKKNEFAKKYWENLKFIAQKCSDFIVSTDYDIEGDVIAYNILRFICKRNDAKRMKFSSLTFEELQNSYRNLMQNLDMGQVNAGLLRHVLDWFWGINTSRALMRALKKNKRFLTLSMGRVQGPALKILAEREMEIRNFVPKKFWQIFLHIDGIKAIYKEKRIFEKEKAEEIYQKCLEKDAKIEKVEKKLYKVLQPSPFNLTDLQKEAFRVFRISPSQTLKLAQNLYMAGLISYPRTSSQKLPMSINYLKIMEGLSNSFYAGLVKKLDLKNLKPREGKKTDPAHPAIFPTGQNPDGLPQNERKIYDLVVKRFLACFSRPCIRENLNIAFRIGDYEFVSEASRTIEKGWLELYEYVKFREEEFRSLKEGDVLKPKKLEIKEGETKPPERYTPASLIAELERKGLGTKSTRSEIIDSLYERGYIKNVQIEVSELGLKVIEIMEKFSKEIVSEELTRRFEEEMEEVRQNRKNKEEVIEEAKAELTKILENFSKHESEIGKELLQSLIESKKREGFIGKCQKCEGELRLIISKKTGKRFVGCSNYSKGCNISFPLPQKGSIKALNKICEHCRSPLIQLNGKKRVLCINPDCLKKRKNDQLS